MEDTVKYNFFFHDIYRVSLLTLVITERKTTCSLCIDVSTEIGYFYITELVKKKEEKKNGSL